MIKISKNPIVYVIIAICIFSIATYSNIKAYKYGYPEYYLINIDKIDTIISKVRGYRGGQFVLDNCCSIFIEYPVYKANETYNIHDNLSLPLRVVKELKNDTIWIIRTYKKDSLYILQNEIDKIHDDKKNEDNIFVRVFKYFKQITDKNMKNK